MHGAHGVRPCSVIVQVINQGSVTVLKDKSDPPIPVDRYRVVPLQASVQRVQFPPWYIHVFWRSSDL